MLATLSTFSILQNSALAQTQIFQGPGQLDPDDQRTSGNRSSLFDRYEFTGRAGQSLTIYLHSTEFDTLLILTDADGNILAYNNDAGSTTTDSELSFVLPNNGRYNVVASTPHYSGRGSYRLAVNENGAPKERTDQGRQSSGGPYGCFHGDYHLICFPENSNQVTVSSRRREESSNSFHMQNSGTQERHLYTWTNDGYLHQIVWRPSDPDLIRLQIFLSADRSFETLNELIYLYDG